MLQRAAFDCYAVKVLTRLLKQAYEPVESLGQPQYWSPHPDTEMTFDSSSPLTQMGDEGRHGDIAHNIRIRESVLKAIAALAAGKDEYRKEFISSDLIPLVVESLSETPKKSGNSKDKAKDNRSLPGETEELIPNPAYGANPLSVLIAACHVVRVMSRSVAILRTALVDNNVAQPIFRFSKHADINARIAATAALINMLVEASPLREVSIPLKAIGTNNSC